MIDVAIVDEGGAAVRQLSDDTVLRAFNAVLVRYGSDPDFCCLRFIAPYHDTIFNLLQVRSLMQELSMVTERLESSEERVAVEEVRAFAEEVAECNHLYLKFFGD